MSDEATNDNKLYGEIAITCRPYAGWRGKTKWVATTESIRLPYDMTWYQSFSARGSTPEEAIARVKKKLCKAMGSLISSEARSGNVNPSVKFHVGDKHGCQLLVDIFTRFPLQTKKQNDFIIWSKAVRLWSNGPSPKKHWSKHTTPEQLEIYHVSMLGFRNDLRKGREYSEPS